MKQAKFTLLGVFVAFLSLIAVAEPRDQRWSVTMGSIDATPCDDAKITLTLRDSADAVVSEYVVPLELNPLGVETSLLTLRVPQLGAYTLTATDHGCSEPSESHTSIAVEISQREIPEQIILTATGNGANWRLYYFGVTRRMSALGVLRFDEDERRLHNISDATMQPCRLTLWPSVRELRLVDGEWEDGRVYSYPGEDEALEAGGEFVLETAGARVIRRRDTKDGDQPGPVLARLLEVRTIPPQHKYRNIGEPPHGVAQEPFPGHCDTYVLELFVSPDYK